MDSVRNRNAFGQFILKTLAILAILKTLATELVGISRCSALKGFGLVISFYAVKLNLLVWRGNMILCPYFPRMSFLITRGYSSSKIQKEVKPTYNTCHNMDPDFLESEHLFICRDKKTGKKYFRRELCKTV